MRTWSGSGSIGRPAGSRWRTLARSVRVESDVLTNTQQEFDDIPDAVGTPITIANPIEQRSDWLWLAPPVAAGAQGAHAVDMHLMENVLGGMRNSDLTFSTNYCVDHGNGNVETRTDPQTYEAAGATDLAANAAERRGSTLRQFTRSSVRLRG